MARYGMLVDVTKCNGCYNCFLACKDEYCEIGHPGYSAPQPMTGQAWMRIVNTERGRFPKVKVDYTAIPCMHCDSPACVTAAPDGAIYKRKDGIVLIDPKKAKGKKDLVTSCPYRVIYWNEEEQVPQKCTLCAHLLDDGWKEPRCVEACPTGALLFGDLDDPKSAVAKALTAAKGTVEALHPEYKLDEKVRYVGLPKAFVAGAVVLGDKDECAVGVTVTLEGAAGGPAAGAKKTTETDAFGDFEFEDLPANTPYRVKIAAPGYRAQELEVRTGASVYLGDIVLTK
jgi:Fe-S-cluster-containing dehydrogenase component